MYQTQAISSALEFRRKKSISKPVVGSTVLVLGITSMLTDISSEMITSVLPVYLMLTAGITPLQFGAIDGINNGATALVRLFSGYFSDRWQKHKEVATGGYALSAAARLGLLFTGGSASAIAATVLVDRVGKGIRTGPRDALISLTSSEKNLSYAFGVHRSLDTFGAMLGPLIAFAVLALAPGEYRLLFVLSMCFAVVGVAVITIYGRNASRIEKLTERVSVRALVKALSQPGVARIAIVVFALGVTTVSDAFVYLSLQHRSAFAPQLFPLMFVGTAAAFAVFAVPVGRFADRVGRLEVMCAGYSLLPVVYLSIMLEPSALFLPLYVAVFGLFYAATDGVLMAYVSTLVPEQFRASGLAAIATSNAVGRLIGPVLFGAVWTWAGIDAALVAFAIALIIVIGFSTFVLRCFDVSFRQ